VRQRGVDVSQSHQRPTITDLPMYFLPRSRLFNYAWQTSYIPGYFFTTLWERSQNTPLIIQKQESKLT